MLCVVGEGPLVWLPEATPTTGGPAGGQQVQVMVCVGSRLGSEARRLRQGVRGSGARAPLRPGLH